MGSRIILTGLLVSATATLSCRTGGLSRTKDVFTVNGKGNVVLFRGGVEKVTVRECPDLSGLKEAVGPEAIEAAIAQYCPRTDSNEREFAANDLRELILSRYQEWYIPNGIPMDFDLKKLQEAANKDWSRNVDSANSQAAAEKQAAIQLRPEITKKINELGPQLAALQKYFESNPEFLDDVTSRTKLEELKKSLEEHQSKLLSLSDEALVKVAKDRLNNIDALKAKDWAEKYSSFINSIILEPLFNSNKLVRLSEGNPVHNRLIDILSFSVYQKPEFKFAEISAGSFLMGSPVSDKDRTDSEVPQFKVTISKGFAIQVTEVTQAQWFSVMGVNPSSAKTRKLCPKEFVEVGDVTMCPNNPVEQVTWDDAKIFIAKLNEKNDGYRYRSPTEAEWEYSARAGTTDPNLKDMNSFAWFSDNAAGISHSVAQKKANAWGVYDMQGNVWEWTSDWLGGYGQSEVTDPTGAPSGALRVIRGGSFNRSPQQCRPAFRGGEIPGARYNTVGLRLVRTRI